MSATTQQNRRGPARGSLGAGLLLLLGVGLAAVAVLPRPALEGWLLGVIALLGMALIGLLLAVLPSGRRTPDGTAAADEPGEDPSDAATTKG